MLLWLGLIVCYEAKTLECEGMNNPKKRGSGEELVT